jgi:hypothetical protein
MMIKTSMEKCCLLYKRALRRRERMTHYQFRREKLKAQEVLVIPMQEDQYLARLRAMRTYKRSQLLLFKASQI